METRPAGFFIAFSLPPCSTRNALLTASRGLSSFAPPLPITTEALHLNLKYTTVRIYLEMEFLLYFQHSFRSLSDPPSKSSSVKKWKFIDDACRLSLHVLARSHALTYGKLFSSPFPSSCSRAPKMSHLGLEHFISDRPKLHFILEAEPKPKPKCNYENPKVNRK